MSNPSVSSRQEIVFILGNLPDIQQLLAGINPGTEVYILDSQQDGLAQMADILAGRSGIDAIHLLSHGGIGELQLGTATLNSGTVNDYAGVLSQISSALPPTGDLLLYGCNVAAGSDGQLLVDTLARITQADVAASSDLTGAAALGGDWVLEYQTGAIEAGLFASQVAFLTYDSSLAATPQTVVVTTGTNMDPTKATTGLVGAGKLITMDSVTLTTGATSNLMVINAYDVDYGMKSSSGVPYAIGNAASEWDGVYIKLYSA